MQTATSGNAFHHSNDSLRYTDITASPYGPYENTNGVAKVVEDRLRRGRSLRNPYSVISEKRDSKYRDGDIHGAKPNFAAHLNLHDQIHKRRNSISVLPSDRSRRDAGRINATKGDNNTSALPTSSSFPSNLPICVERQVDDDLDTFRQARACGMTLDTFSVSKPRSLQISTRRTDCGEPADKGSPMDAFTNSFHPAPGKTFQDEGVERSGSPRTRERPQSLYEISSRYENLIIPAPYSTPSSPVAAPYAKKLAPVPRTTRPAPPFAPVLDPNEQLVCIDRLLKAHQALFNAGCSSVQSVVATVEDLIDVGRLLNEHAVDTQLENRRRKQEREKSGSDFFERTRKSDSQSAGGDWRLPMSMIDINDRGYCVFGQQLSRTRLYASCVCSMAGYQHDLPVVVYACIEELYRTGMTAPGLFRTAPVRTRYDELIKIFDEGPTFGRSISLSKERTADVCALLRHYIDRLPHAIWHEALFDPLLRLCVWPSLLVEKSIVEAMENEESNGGSDLSAAYQIRKTRPTSLLMHTSPLLGSPVISHTHSSSLDDVFSISNSLSSTSFSAMTLYEVDPVREKPQLVAARALFRLLPRAQLALLAYLCAFFTQVPLCPANQVSIEELSRLFAVPLFLGKADGGAIPISPEVWNKRKQEAYTMMVWILKRWAFISEGLFDAGDIAFSYGSDADDVPLTSASSADDSDSIQTTSSGVSREASGSGSDRLGISKPQVNGDDREEKDIQAWKLHVEKDITDLQRALIEVRTHFER